MPKEAPFAEKDIKAAARATIELFGDEAIGRTSSRLADVEDDSCPERQLVFWRLMLDEVKRLVPSSHR